MRNALILGSGRSGTSMVTGTLASSGYFVGDKLHTARRANPKGFFEAASINDLNEELLAPMLAPGADLGDGQRWLGVPTEGSRPSATTAQQELIRDLLSRSPCAYKDPRFSFTLPAWREHAQDAGLICVFRDPARTAASLVQEVSTAPYLEGVSFDLSRAFELWIATYRAILERVEEGGDWLFLHYDQCLSRDGLARLGEFLEADLDESFADPLMRRAAPDLEVPQEAQDLYAELCRRAGFSHSDEAPTPRPRVAVIAHLGPRTRAAEALLAARCFARNAASQRSVEVELVVVDATWGGELEAADIRSSCPGLELSVLRCTSLSRARGVLDALEHTEADFIGLMPPADQHGVVPEFEWLPAHLARSVAALEASPAAVLSTCNQHLTDPYGQFVEQVDPWAGAAPCGAWEGSLVVRREALDLLDPAAFFPSELALALLQRATGAAVHVEEPGLSLDRRVARRLGYRVAEDVALIAALESSGAADHEVPSLTVSIATYQRPFELLESVEAFARQQLPRGSFEVTVIESSDDGTAARLAATEFAVPLLAIDAPGQSLAAARNTGLAASRGELVLFVNDDTIPSPDLIERHLEAHAAQPEDVSVIGVFAQPPEALDNSLMRVLEDSSRVFAFAEMKAGERYDGFKFWTCNVSVSRARVASVGGFDESFGNYGCEDTDLGFRLEAAGLDVVYEPRAHAWHRHVLDLDDLKRRQRQVARNYVRLVRKHPHVIRRWQNEGRTLSDCRASVARNRRSSERLEAAARELSALDTGTLSRAGAETRELAGSICAELDGLLTRLDRGWWSEGYALGLEELGLHSFGELLARGEDPRPFETSAQRKLLAFPRWEDRQELERLFRTLAPAVGEDLALVLVRDPLAGPERGVALANLQQAFDAVLEDDVMLDVELVEETLDPLDLLWLGRSVDAQLVLGSEPAESVERIAAERLEGTEQLSRWCARYSAATIASPA